MTPQMLEDIASAILYEGYILYPYRPSALKNQQRFNFGVVAPRHEASASAGVSALETQCVIRASEPATLDVRVRFLHLTTRQVNSADWEEAIERVVPSVHTLDDLHRAPARTAFSWPAMMSAGRVQERLDGEVTVAAESFESAPDLVKITVRIENATATSDDADLSRRDSLKRSLVAAHVLLRVTAGEFLSAIDPPPGTETVVASCHQCGLWPVLVGDASARDAMLAAPIILYDYPQIAAESAADFCDGTEIDEMLVLRILTLTDQEKQEMRDGDERARRLLERAESLPDDHLMRLHGVLRDVRLPDGSARHE